MIKREECSCWQWDLGCKVLTDQPYVHFAHLHDAEALVVEAVDGEAEIPNILLQDSQDIYAWAYDGARVRQGCKLSGGMRIPVNARPRPQGYIYEPTQVMELEELKEWVKEQIAEFTMRPPSLKVGKVETLEPGEPVTIENTGDELNAVLNIGIPKGEKGDTGDTGETGEQGDAGRRGTLWGIGEAVGDGGGEVEGQLELDCYLNSSNNTVYQLIDGTWQSKCQLAGGSGIYMLKVYDDGCLYALCEDGQAPPNYEYDDETGDLYVAFDDGE